MKFNIINFGYRVLGEYPSRYLPIKNLVRKSLAMAGLRINHVVYISTMTFWSMLGAILACIFTTPFIFALNLVLRLNISLFQVIFIILQSALGTAIIIFVAFLYYPRHIAGRIKTGIDKNIVYIINYMSTLAGAGVTSEEIFTSLADTGETYKVAKSTKSIVRDIEILGKDIVTAISEESETIPSKRYSLLLQGIIGTIRTGGDLKEYLKESAEHQMEIRERQLAGLVDNLNLAAEVYIMLGIAFPIILTTLLSLMGVFGGEIGFGLGPVEFMMLMTYIIFPLASLGVIILIDGLTESW